MTPRNTAVTEERYLTRYGVMTASQAANEMLERAEFRLSFLICDLGERGGGGSEFTFPPFSLCGLAYILEDIKDDLEQSGRYFQGAIVDPGKIGEAPGECHE